MEAGIRVEGPTPSGGDYSEAFYLDAAHNIVDPETATEVIIRECLMDGTVINTTYAKVN